MKALSHYAKKELLPHVPYAAIGGLTGAGIGYGTSRMSNEPLRQQVQELQAIDPKDRTFQQSKDLAFKQVRLTAGEWEETHPRESALLGALIGAGIGVSGGPSVVQAVRDTPKQLDRLQELLQAIDRVKKG